MLLTQRIHGIFDWKRLQRIGIDFGDVAENWRRRWRKWIENERKENCNKATRFSWNNEVSSSCKFNINRIFLRSKIVNTLPMILFVESAEGVRWREKKNNITVERCIAFVTWNCHRIIDQWKFCYRSCSVHSEWNAFNAMHVVREWESSSSHWLDGTICLF